MSSPYVAFLLGIFCGAAAAYLGVWLAYRDIFKRTDK